jgi:hypothetical protein
MNLYRLARHVATASAICSCKPHRVIRRGKNLVVGRALAKAGFWRMLWR